MRELALSAFRPAAPPPLGDAEVHLWFFPQWQGPARGTAESVPIRQLLGSYLAEEPAALDIRRDARGKPRLAGGELEFNVSHSGSALLLAVCRRHALGVDLEIPRRPRPVLELAQRYFAPREASALAALPENLQQQAFLRVWACKEAVLKAHGGGISVGLELVTFDIGPDGSVRALAGTHGALSASDWRIVKLGAEGGACGALAWRGPDLAVRACPAVC